MARDSLASWTNSIGLLILVLGLAAALVTVRLSALQPWSERAGPIVLLTLLAYSATVTVYLWPGRETPELRRVRRLREDHEEAVVAGSAHLGAAPCLTGGTEQAAVRGCHTEVALSHPFPKR